MGDYFTSITFSALPQPDHRVLVWSKTQLVGLTGFEPATP